MTTTRRQPLGWTSATLPAIVGADGLLCDGDWVESEDQDPNGSVRLTQLADIGDGYFRDKSKRFLRPDQAERLGCTFLKAEDVLVARMPDPLGRACLYPGGSQPAVTAVDVCIIRPGSSGISARWLMHAINAPQFRSAVAKEQRGSTRKRISKKSLCEIELPVPPSLEQLRIADGIDSHFTRLDNAVASLARVQAKLKSYRASVFKAAVEGRLVPTEASLARAEKREYEPAEALLDRILKERRQRWEEAELAKLKGAGKTPNDDRWKARYEVPASSQRSKLPELPEGWCWASLDQLLHLLRNGQSMAPREKTGVRILRISAVRPLAVDFQDVRFLPGEPADYQDDLIEVGDLLFTRYNGTPSLVGVCGRVRMLTEATVHPDKLIKVRLCSDLHVPYVELAANVGESRRFIERRTRTTAGQAGISGSDLKQMPIPVPPLSEQVRIAAEVERLVSVADETKAAVAIDERRCLRLRQSTLKWAFEGKLVDQDAADEPAEKLLARIRAERATEAPLKKNGRRKARRAA